MWLPWYFLTQGCTFLVVPIFPFSLPPDEATLELMKTPRCSLPDLAGPVARRRRHTQAVTKWNKRNLSWR